MPIQFTLNYSYLLAYVGMSFRMFTLNFQQAITLRSHFFADGINTLKNSLVKRSSENSEHRRPNGLSACPIQALGTKEQTFSFWPVQKEAVEKPQDLLSNNFQVAEKSLKTKYFSWKVSVLHCSNRRTTNVADFCVENRLCDASSSTSVVTKLRLLFKEVELDESHLVFPLTRRTYLSSKARVRKDHTPLRLTSLMKNGHSPK